MRRSTDFLVGSTLTSALEEAWRSIRQTHPEIPQVVMLLGVGSEGRRWLTGHFARSRWVTPNDNASTNEVMVAGEAFRFGAAKVLEVLLHEAAHAINAAANIVDTTRNNRYHNEHFARAAEKIGLECFLAMSQGIGWQVRAVKLAALDHYKFTLQGLEAAHDTVRKVYRIDMAREFGAVAAAGEQLRPRRPTRSVLACTCRIRIELAAGVAEAGVSIRCDVCGDRFTAPPPKVAPAPKKRGRPRKER